jgi:hypothetical protein
MDQFIKEETVTTRTAKQVVNGYVNSNEALISVKPTSHKNAVYLTVGARYEDAWSPHFNKKDLGDLIDILLGIRGTMEDEDVAKCKQ